MEEVFTFPETLTEEIQTGEEILVPDGSETLEIINSIDSANINTVGLLTVLIFFTGIVGGALMAVGLWGVHRNV